jgi:hypothetical protein
VKVHVGNRWPLFVVCFVICFDVVSVVEAETYSKLIVQPVQKAGGIDLAIDHRLREVGLNHCHLTSYVSGTTDDIVLLHPFNVEPAGRELRQVPASLADLSRTRLEVSVVSLTSKIRNSSEVDVVDGSRDCSRLQTAKVQSPLRCVEVSRRGSGSPVITRIDPWFGAPGDRVTIRGYRFDSSTTVAFNGVTANVVHRSKKRIVCTVPFGAITGPVVLSTNGVRSNCYQFFVLELLLPRPSVR